MGRVLTFEVCVATNFHPVRVKSIYNFDSGHDQEQEYVLHIYRLAKERRTTIYVLLDAGRRALGFIAFHIEQRTIRGHFKVIMVVDYLFVSAPFRRIAHIGLGGKKISEYLVNFSISVALQMTEPVHYVALEPAHDKLVPFYQSLGFEGMDKTPWMYLALRPSERP